MLLGLLAVSATASPVSIVSSHDYLQPYGSWNGKKIFLSSPRHGNSGSRGECRNPGYEENVNGRRFNWYAANGDFYGEQYDPDSVGRNLRARGYKVVVGANARDGNYKGNYNRSRNYGSDVHIVSHTNASAGCRSSAQYLLTMYRGPRDENIAREIGTTLNGVTPGDLSVRYEPQHLELQVNATRGDAYVELSFHDNRTGQDWLYSKSTVRAWRYGWSVDRHMDYP